MNVSLLALKAKIKGFEAVAEKTRKKIQSTSGLRRAKAWTTKRELGNYARNHLLAYGLLRGVPYSALEPKCSPANEAVLQIDVIRQIIAEHVSKWEFAKWSEEKVKQLLTRGDAK